MNALAGIVGLVFILLNIVIYGWHKKHIPNREDNVREYYAISPITRLFSLAKILLYALIFIHIVAFGIISPASIHWPLFTLGCFLGVCSLVLLHLCLKALGPNFSPCDKGIKPNEIIRYGPYRWCRHPIYLTNLVQLIAFGLLVNGVIIWVVFVVLMIFYGFSIRDEEHGLYHKDLL